MVLLVIGILMGIYGTVILIGEKGNRFSIAWYLTGGFFFASSVLLKHGVLRGGLLAVWIAAVCAYTAMLAVNCMHILHACMSDPDENCWELLVLGARVMPHGGPSNALRYRCRSAADYLKEHSDCGCIVSGGKGVDEPCSEAECMQRVLMEMGIDRNRIRLEDKSRSTIENLRYSKQMLDSPDESIAVVTSSYHLYRSLRIARRMGMKNVSGIGAKTKVLYLPSALYRECLSIAMDSVIEKFRRWKMSYTYAHRGGSDDDA